MIDIVTCCVLNLVGGPTSSTVGFNGVLSYTGSAGTPLMAQVSIVGQPPLVQGHTVSLDWGDGHIDEVVVPPGTGYGAYVSHTYQNGGTFTVIAQAEAGPPFSITYTSVEAADPFANMAATREPPYENAVEVQPTDTADLTVTAESLLAVTTGTVQLTTRSGTVVNLPTIAGVLLPVRVRRVWATGTTATLIAVW